MTQNIQPKDDHYRLIGLYLLAVAALILWLFSSCATKQCTESSADVHRMSVMTEHMDSMLHAISHWQQSLYEKQTSLVDSFKHSELRDTSHTIFLGAKGDTVKETIVIKEYIEREHLSQKKETERWEEIIRRTDSLLQVSMEKQKKQDSLLRTYQKTTMVEKQASLVTKMQWFIGGIVLAIIGMLVFVFAYMRKKSFFS